MIVIGLSFLWFRWTSESRYPKQHKVHSMWRWRYGTVSNDKLPIYFHEQSRIGTLPVIGPTERIATIVQL